MARPTARQLKGAIFPGELQTPLRPSTRRQIERDLGALLAWQRDLVRWTRPKSRVDAIPFVALYLNGRLCGCFGDDAADPGERLARAFLKALNDSRFGSVPERARSELAAEVGYARNVVPIVPAHVEATFEVGTHGLGVRRDDGTPVVLLPSVARDNGYGPRGMLDALLRKAGASASGGNFFTFEVDRVVARCAGRGARVAGPRQAATRVSTEDAAAAWMARLVQRDGSVLLAVDARTGLVTRTGEMHHARTAAAVEALALHGGYPVLVARARKRLERDAQRASSGMPIEAWPTDTAKVAGTLAHLARAGVEVTGMLTALARQPDVLRAPWHAAQVAAALGAAAPKPLVDACVASLDTQPWAPWTVLALARQTGNGIGDALSRSVNALVASVRAQPPHRGAVNATPIPEVALTALTVEALRRIRADAAARAAIARAVAFLSASQITPERAPAAFDLDVSTGAFVGSPISSTLRADVTAHAFVAIRGTGDSESRSRATPRDRDPGRGESRRTAER
jgi:hypothetical protein